MASDQLIHMVPLHGDLFSFQCKQTHSKGSEITFCRMAFNRDSGIFLNDDDEVTPLYKNASRSASIVCCASVVNIKMRQKVPCVLLKHHRKGPSGFKYMLYSLSSRTTVKLDVEFSLPYEMIDDVSVLRGPTIVWRHEDAVFYTSAETGSVKEVPIHLTVNFLGEIPLPRRTLAILGLQKTTDDEEMENETEDKMVLYFIEDGRTFSADCLLPSAYNSVVRCVLVLSAEELAGLLRSTVVAATCRKQLVLFENGLPEEVCLLPYEEPQSIQAVHVGSGCLLVIIFQCGNVCAVWRDTFKVAACWTDVRLVFVDDFVGSGSEQMLLLFNNSADGILEKFLLTDLCGVCYSHGREEGGGVSRCETAEENITLTIQALESRLQEGLVSLLDEQSEEDECTPLMKMFETNVDNSHLEVERVWHRVVGQRLVFGALLAPSNQMKKSDHLIAAVIATPPMVQSVNKIICYPEPLTSGPPSAKRSRAPPAPAVLMVTDLSPLLNFNPIKCSVLLCSSTTDDEGNTSQHCKLVCLDLKGALEGKLQPCLLEDSSVDSDESREDLLSLMVAFESWRFHIVSTDHSVVNVLGFLEERFKAKRIKISPQYLLSRSTQLSGAVLFCWSSCSSFDGMLDVYCSDHLCVLRVLDALCNLLPVSHCVKLLRNGQGRNRSPALIMAHEICAIKEGVNDLIGGGAEELSNDFNVHFSREQWLKEKSGQLRPLVEEKLYRGMVERAIGLQMASDVAMLVEAELNDDGL
ncbi:Fanconi anemia group B protein [Silurus asotus]|uniref:Fanconi anemia group B protein n=1 Tax=Silurus asotus TaxID=30991 RepID=A0AAD5B7F9_SILAS|nr:Fanconi anemia group B protein [Silurus asotus]